MPRFNPTLNFRFAGISNGIHFPTLIYFIHLNCRVLGLCFQAILIEMQELPVINRTQELYEAVAKITEKLPAIKRQTLGRRLEDGLLELLGLLIMAKYAPKSHKGAYLIKAAAQTEIIQFELRILLTQKLANETTLHQLQAKTSEIGRMLGGWRKSVQ